MNDIRKHHPQAHCDMLCDPLETAECRFLRFHGRADHTFPGVTRLQTCPAGGWLLEGAEQAFWLPRLPVTRRLDDDGHILADSPAPVEAVALGPDGLTLTLAPPPDQVTDLVVWRLTPQLQRELTDLTPIETQAYFLWGSHTRYTRPADLYLHLIHGRVYENRATWPKHWKICSENDAHALYVLFSGLERATGKRLYRLFKQQLLLSVLDRQADDGGFYHGEWTDAMESHFRLAASAAHLLMDALEEYRDPAIEKALLRAAEFLSRQHDRLDCGIWFLHDSLETSEAAMRQSPFRWLPSRAFGKSVGNMLVLNTHLDLTIALARCQELTGRDFSTLVGQAHQATCRLLPRRPAEWLYRLLFHPLRLTSLPAEAASRLPLPLRALKRLGWKYIAPHLHRVKTRWPRFVMPGGYIDRAICLQGWAFHYLTINIMDILRYARKLDPSAFGDIVQDAIRFTQDSGIRARWRELRYEKYALGFWAEALYHLCLTSTDPAPRAWLAEAVVDLDGLGMGIPPSLLGGNGEAVPCHVQRPALMPSSGTLRIVNLSRPDTYEYVWVNTGSESLTWPVPAAMQTADWTWRTAAGELPPPAILELEPAAWIHATKTDKPPTR